MKFQIVDAHLHIPNSMHASRRIIETLVHEMDAAEISKAVLIINTIDELSLVKEDYQTLIEYADRLHIVSGVNINSTRPFEIYEFFNSKGICPDIKLHPKMYKYTRDNFAGIKNAISMIPSNNVVIDTLYFGEQIENHIGIELGIYLAREFLNKRIILAHSGSIKLLECQMYTRNLHNIYYDLSFTSSYLNHTSIRLDMINFLKHTSSRIMFGSDYPSFDFTRAKTGFSELCTEAKLNNEELNNVCFYNAEKVYWNPRPFNGDI